MVQIQNEIADKVAATDVTKILGQPTNQSIDLLKQELTVMQRAFDPLMAMLDTLE